MNIAMLISGGVDSAVAVHRLVEQGHTPHLFYIRIGLDTDEGDCAAEEDIEMCSLIAARYHLPLDIVPLHQEYWDNVMAYALRTVKEGLTPNPDIMCNKMIKFGYFEERVGHEFDATATGHYATIRNIDGRTYLGTAPDPVKDQTDFLARISYKQLCHLMFPIGDLPKAEVRRIAELTSHLMFTIGDLPKAEVRRIAELTSLPNARRRDSQGICFLGKINYNDFIRRHLGERPGPIIEIETGRKLGEHRGYWFHTIGQRKGLGLSGGQWYVVRKNVHDNVIYVSQGYDTARQYGDTMHLSEMHFITADPWGDKASAAGVEGTFKNRHTPMLTPGTLTRIGAEGEYVLHSAEPVQGIAPGQFAVIYDKESRLCYGSGIISGGAVQI